MKKIKAKIINEYNRHLISFKNSIKKELRSLRSSLLKEFSRFSALIRKTFLYFVRLKFMKSKKVRISLLSRYLILFIILLFSSLFYFSVPFLYNYVELQKELTKKLSEEFGFNTSLSANITYKILPAPNFEISNVFLNTNIDNNFNEYAQIKEMKVYISTKNLHNQKELEIKNIVLSKANFNINKNSYDYLNNYLKNKISNKKIQIKKSKIFFREDDSNKEVVALSTVNKSNIFYDKKNQNNIMTIKGSIYNTKYNFILSRNVHKKNETNTQIKFKKLDTIIKNNFFENLNKKNNYYGTAEINFSGSEINASYKIIDKLITLQSEKSLINNQNVGFSGTISTSPFYYDININLEQINIAKLIANLSKTMNLLDQKILLNDHLNGKIVFNIKTLKGIKFFDEAKIILTILNGKLMLSDSFLISNKIGKMFFTNFVIESINNKNIFKSKILFEITNEKKFYQKLQITKANRIKLKNIYFEIEKEINIENFKINKFILNKAISNNSLIKSKNLTNLLNINTINNLKNWIEFKKFSNQIFSEIASIN